MNHFRIIATVLSLLTAFTVIKAETCECTAPDGSCSANVTCAGGCIKFCGNNNNCYVRCISEEEDNSPSALPTARVTLKATNADSKKITSELKRVTGREIKFVAKKQSQLFNFDFDDVPLWEVLEVISRYGKLTINGIDFDRYKELRKSLSKNEKISMCLRKVPVRSAVAYLSFLTGLPLSIVSGNAELSISSSYRRVTVHEIISRMSEQTGVKIVLTETLPTERAALSMFGSPNDKDTVLAPFLYSGKHLHHDSEGIRWGMFSDHTGAAYFFRSLLINRNLILLGENTVKVTKVPGGDKL